jgi:hypothetical protein
MSKVANFMIPNVKCVLCFYDASKCTFCFLSFSFVAAMQNLRER